MKNFKRNHLVSPRRVSKRQGLSIIEVLTSIVVALIGVFGVLAMIPFAVKQTQTGLDQDTATSLARSALSNFEAAGFKVVSRGPSAQMNWAMDAAGTPLVIDQNVPLVCIDPLGVAEQGSLFSVFPFNSNSPITMPAVSLIRPDDGRPFDLADARRMFRITDDLVFEQDDNPDVNDSGLLGPVQIFNEGPAGLLNRQSIGSISWCAVAQPVVNFAGAQEIDSFKFNVLVFKDRVTDSTAVESAMLAGTVTTPSNFAQPLTTITTSALGADVRRDDWVMLINRDPALPPNLGTNIAFARVNNTVGGDNGTPLDTSDDTTTLTLNGPDFNFSFPTTVVHLKDVVAVFPRTIKLESSSEWTAGN